MNSEIKMSVSSMTRTGNKKAVYVLFQDGSKTAEFMLPGCELVRNKGFSEDDIRQLKDYIDNEQDSIFAVAKQVNPIKAMMGMENVAEELENGKQLIGSAVYESKDRDRSLEYSFRQCENTDIDFIYTLKERCFKWYVEKIYGWNKDVQMEYTRKEMAERLEHMSIIQTDGKDIGLFTFFYDKNGDACIGMFAILPEYQGKGLGTKILNETLDRNIGVRVYLKTYKENPARFLYQKVGFVKYGETETHWLMEKSRIEDGSSLPNETK